MFTDIGILPNSPLTMSLHVLVLTLSSNLHYFICRTSIIFDFSYPQTSQPYNKIGVISLSNNSKAISKGKQRDLTFHKSENIALLACSTSLDFVL